MKKFAAAAIAATMTLGAFAAPADAASNTMGTYNYQKTCKIVADRPGDLNIQSGTFYQKDIKKKLDNEEFGKLADFTDSSSKIGEAFGSSDQSTINDANNLQALKACVAGNNFQSQPMDEGEKAGIIIGIVLAAVVGIASAAWPVVAPMLGM